MKRHLNKFQLRDTEGNPIPVKPFELRTLKNEADADETVMIIDGYIGRDYWEEYMTGEPSPNVAEALRSKLAEINTPKIRIDIHSPGGNLSEGLVMYDILKEKDAEITTRMQGLSASAATLIAQAASPGKRLISSTSAILIHRVMAPVMGYFNSVNFRDMLEESEELDKMIIALYVNATNGKSKYEDIVELMDKGLNNQGSFITAETALNMGLVDAVYTPSAGAEPEKENKQDRAAAQLAKRLTMFTKQYNQYAKL